MAIEIAAWNLQAGLAVNGRADRLADAICHLDKDVVVLGDAYWLGKPAQAERAEIAGAALERFADNDYKVIEAEYGDALLWPGHYLTVLSRLAVTRSSVVGQEARNAVELEVKDPATGIDVHIIGAHFSDHSEERRLAQVDALLGMVDTDSPTVLAGDLNAMPGSSWRAAFLRSRAFGVFGSSCPHPQKQLDDEPRFDQTSRATRLAAMASGTTLERLDKAGLRSTSPEKQLVRPRRRSTIPAGLPLVQLDHILVTEHVTASNYRVHNPLLAHGQLSDHRPVSVTLET